MLPTLQEMVDIASGYETFVAHALVRACLAKALELGVPLRLPKRAREMRDPDPFVIEEPDPFWRRMVERNREPWRRVHG